MLLQIIILPNTKNPHNFYCVIFTELEKNYLSNFQFGRCCPPWADGLACVYELNISPNCGGEEI